MCSDTADECMFGAGPPSLKFRQIYSCSACKACGHFLREKHNQGCHLGLQIGTKKHKFGREHCRLAHCQVSSIPVQQLQKKSINVSVNQKPGWPSWMMDWHENHKLGS